eukprot:6182511-Pleurochrysis_carterae.AAC.1
MTDIQMVDVPRDGATVGSTLTHSRGEWALGPLVVSPPTQFSLRGAPANRISERPGNDQHNPSIDCYSRVKELLNYLYSTKGMTLVLGGKSISVPHFDTFRDAGAEEINHNELAQLITGNYGLHFYSYASWMTDRTYIAHLGMSANGPVDWSSRLLKVATSPS